MSRHPILIRHITHLTDARYFAAMGVDWMSIQLTPDPTTFHRWHSIRDWVEGVRLVAEIDATDETLFAKTIIDAVPDGLLMDTPSELPVPEGLTLFLDAGSGQLPSVPSGSRIILPFDASQVWAGKDSHHLFLQADWTEAMMAALIHSGYQGGFCLMGEDEVATGIRDYEKMDKLLEFLFEDK